MTEPTPGPWDTDEGDLCVVCELESSEIIATCNELLPQYAANARFIAAAPDMEKALEDLLAKLHSLGYVQKSTEVANARVALAKAKGE